MGDSNASRNGSDPLVFVTVGTDAFPFDRLMGWLEGWIQRSRSSTPKVLVQTGPSTAPAGAESARFLPYDQLQDTIGRATAVVCHGAGPSILEVVEQGLVPIVVPRRRSLGEAVDDHQVHFSRRLAAEGNVRIAESAQDLERLLDAALDDPSSFQLTGQALDTGAVGAFEEETASLGFPSQGRPRVLYIAGTERSGSTLLERLLGEVSGVCATGELVHLWERGLIEDQLCGCGEPFSGCPLWRAVGDEAFGGWDTLDGAQVNHLKHSVDRHRYLPLIASPGLSPSYEGRRREFSALLSALYRALATVTDSVVVDSSKSSSYLTLLRGLPDIDLRMVHLVRDSRGVAYSTAKHVERPEVSGGERYMPKYGPVRSSADWTIYNLLFELLGTTGIPSMLLRYEDLVSDPRRHVGQILRFAGVPVEGRTLEFIHDRVVDLHLQHSVSGNPMRFQSGTVPLRVDDEWRTNLRQRSRTVVSTVTWPLLRRYRYAA